MKETGSGGTSIHVLIHKIVRILSKIFSQMKKKLFEPYVGEILPQDTSTVVCRDYDPC